MTSRVAARGLVETARPLIAEYDVVLLDLDGVLYHTSNPIPGAAAAVAMARAAGVRCCFVTNNASRGPEQIAVALERMGIPAQPAEIVTSAHAAAVVLAERLTEGTAILILGSASLAAEVAAVGLKPVFAAHEEPAAVVQGLNTELTWAELAEATLALRAGAWWVATNGDTTLPTSRGLVPGNGALVAALAAATGRQPDVVVGKPYPRLFREALRRVPGKRPLVVGDRLDTDIEGAHRANCDSLLVLTGVSTATDLLATPPSARPTYVAADLAGLVAAHPSISWQEQTVHCGGWHVDHTLALTGNGDALDALRALATMSWRRQDAGERPVTPSAESESSRAALRALTLGNYGT